MGLDITHYRATYEKAESYTLFNIGNGIYHDTGAETKENFEGFNVEFDHFSKYIQEINIPQVVEELIIVKRSENLEKVKTHFQLDEHQFLVKESEGQLRKEIKKLESKKGYRQLEIKIQNIETVDWDILRYYTIKKKEGFYFKSVGNQRKGMNNDFWNKFINSNIYNFANKEDFDYALSCIDHCWHSDTEESFGIRKENFEKNFVAKFESGSSFMSLSY